MARERTQLERSEALFEQRKIAAREEIENADETMSMIRESEANLNDEMEKLVQLSDFVRKKDAEAQEKLSHAEELSIRLKEMDSSLKQDFENADMQRQEISENRMSLARERVSLLKERSRDRESHRLSKGVALLQGPSCEEMVTLTKDFGFAQPSLRREVTSIKDDLTKLRQE